MRDPANFVIVDGAAATMYCESHAAGHLGPILLAGSDNTIQRLRGGEQVEDFDPWCEAVVLIDMRQRVLALYGMLNMSWFEGSLTPSTNQLRYAYRAAYRALLEQAWPGWQLRWAYEGIDDIVRYLGNRYRGGGYKYSSRRLPSVAWEEEPLEHCDPESDNGPVSLFVTVAAVPGVPLRAYFLDDYFNAAFGVGAALLTALPAIDPVTELPYPPDTGMHLDPVLRHATLWTIGQLSGVRESWPRLWSGWQLELKDDRYETQVALCDDQVFILEPDMPSAWAHLTRWADPATISTARTRLRRPPRWPPLVIPPGTNLRRRRA